MHVADRVDVNHQRNKGHDQHHRRRQLVNQEADLKVRRLAFQPGIQRAIEGVTVEHVLENDSRAYDGHDHAQDRYEMRRAVADFAAQQT